MAVQNRREQAARTPLSPESLERSPTEPQGEKAESTEESRVLHMSKTNTAIVNARSTSAVPLHRMLRDHFLYDLVYQPLPDPAPFPLRQRRRETRERVSCASESEGRLKAYSWAGCCLLQSFLLAHCIPLLSQATAVIGIAVGEVGSGGDRGRERE